MPGLLDIFNMQNPQQQGLLGAAAAILNASGPSAVPHSFGQVLSQGLLGGMQANQLAQDRQMQQAMRDLQMQSLSADLEDQQVKRRQQRDIEAAARAALKTPEQMAASLPGGPTIANAARIPDMKGGFDTEDFLSRVMAINPIMGLQFSQQLRKAGPKFDTKINYVNGPDGKPMAVLVAEDGSTKTLAGMSPREKLHFLSTGGKTLGVGEFSGEQMASYANTVDPNTVYSGNITMRGQNMSDARARELNAITANNKAPTEFQGKSAAFGLRATEADKILNGLQGKYSPASINTKNALSNVWGVGGLLGAGANTLLSDDAQRVEQAQRDFVNAILRQESGAAISPGEFDNAAKQYFPQPGDSKAVIEQKARNRQLAIQGLQTNAGRAAMIAAPQQPAAGGIKFLGFE